MRTGARSMICFWAWLLAATALAQPTEPPADRSEDASASASASATASATPRTPKVALVISGDPDPAALAAAQSLEGVLASDSTLTMPTDAAMRAALRGEGSGDGLDDVRAERRHLGLGEARDVTALTVLGELAGADLVLVIRSAHGVTQATAFDVLRRSFYDGELTLEPLDVAHATHFVTRRAQRAARPLDPSEPVARPPEPPPPPVVDPATAVPPEAIAPDAEPPPHQPDFFEQYWPYFVAGALLIGAVVFVVFTTQNSSTPPPVLRFEAGGGS